MRRTRAGVTLMEMLVSLFMSLIIAAALFNVFATTYTTRDDVVGQGVAETTARSPIDALADHLRDAQQFWTTGATPPTLISQSSVIAAGTKTSITYYKSNSGTDTVQYFLSGTNLKRTADGVTSVVLTNVSNLEFQYLTSATYNGTAVSTANKNAPTAAELPQLSEINIIAAVNVSGFTRQLGCLVRLRNSPYKVSL